MANRHLARSVVLQVLFEKDSTQGGMTTENAVERLADYAKEFGARDSDMPFMKALLQTAIAKQKEIDDVIVGAPNLDAPSFLVGAAYIVYGKSSGFSASISVDSLDGNNGFAIFDAQGNPMLVNPRAGEVGRTGA